MSLTTKTSPWDYFYQDEQVTRELHFTYVYCTLVHNGIVFHLSNN